VIGRQNGTGIDRLCEAFMFGTLRTARRLPIAVSSGTQPEEPLEEGAELGEHALLFLAVSTCGCRKPASPGQMLCRSRSARFRVPVLGGQVLVRPEVR